MMRYRPQLVHAWMWAIVCSAIASGFQGVGFPRVARFFVGLAIAYTAAAVIHLARVLCRAKR